MNHNNWVTTWIRLANWPQSP